MSSNLGSGLLERGRDAHAEIALRARSSSPLLKRSHARPALATPRAVLFDLDGTLIDTMQVFADVAADVMVRHHGADRARSRAAYLTTSGIPFFQQLELMMPRDSRNADAAAEFEIAKLEATDDVRATDTTLGGLAQLRRLGIATAISSNNFQAQVDKFISHCPVEIDLALGFGDGLAKGESHFDRACDVFDCTRDALVFVGDSIADAELARSGGVRFVARLGTFEARAFQAVLPDAPAVDEISELVRLFVG